MKHAVFMVHPIRQAMLEEVTGPLGASRKTVEADETYFGSESGSVPTAKDSGDCKSGKALVDEE